MSSSWSSWRTGSGHDYGSSYAPNNTTNVNDSNRIEPFFRHSVSFQPTSDATRRDPWQIPEERVIRRPFSFSGFPDHRRTSAPVQIVWLESVPATPPPPRVVNPRFSGPLPRYTVQQQVQVPPAPTPAQQDDSRSTQDEENIVLSKLKREIYNPVPKQMTRRLNSYYRNGSSFNDKEKDDDGKRCAICLEDFEPREQVMLTPCDHMFHEECIVPWMKSHGQCPVCRYVLSERIRQTATSISNNNASNVAATDLFAGELISIIRAMEEAFLWGNSR
ncbi:Zinc finger, RING-type [Corchorus olitorius]|uniref:Zinc finger, RING-type n=1 Tax=Corchorus olitorius TaxID=93759 RepID=A0A1R3K672_9ROSI|nr:Zinc finger, RING-type [Corchorus olitorius]